MEKLKYAKAVCYSGYREGQSPHRGIYPSYEEVLEDLRILEREWGYIRMYDTSEHVKTTLKVIRENNIDLKVMIGTDIRGEIDNLNCSWGGRQTPESIARNQKYNESSIQKSIDLANQYKDIVFAVSAGNEAVPDWTGNLVKPERIFEFVKTLKENITQLVTYCDGADVWIDRLEEVAKIVDLVSVHTYPAWHEKTIDENLEFVVKDFNEVQDKYSDKYCIITETGWPTSSDGARMKVENVGEDQQAKCYNEIINWSKENDTLVFFFEAFDEPWKGGSSPDEPEKNWGLFDVHRNPKKAVK